MCLLGCSITGDLQVEEPQAAKPRGRNQVAFTQTRDRSTMYRGKQQPKHQHESHPCCVVHSFHTNQVKAGTMLGNTGKKVTVGCKSQASRSLSNKQYFCHTADRILNIHDTDIVHIPLSPFHICLGQRSLPKHWGKSGM